MNDLKVYRVTGAFGLAGVVLFLSQIPLYMAGAPVPPINELVADVRDIPGINWSIQAVGNAYVQVDRRLPDDMRSQD